MPGNGRSESVLATYKKPKSWETAVGKQAWLRTKNPKLLVITELIGILEKAFENAKDNIEKLINNDVVRQLKYTITFEVFDY